MKNIFKALKLKSSYLTLLFLLISLPILTLEVGKHKLLESDAQESEKTATFQPEELPKPDSVIIKYKDGIDEKRKIKIMEEKNIGEEIVKLKYTNIVTMKITDHRIEEAISKIEKDPDIEYVEPDCYLQLFEIPNDPDYPKQWYLPQIQASKAWKITKSSSDISIAIIDAGVNVNHPELSSKIIKRMNNQNDEMKHGTHVAGIAAASTNNNTGISSVGYNTSLFVADLGHPAKKLSMSKLAQAIRWATDNGADVINMSLGVSTANKTCKEAVNYAWSRGVTLVAAAGNNGNKNVNYPAGYSKVFSVAATNKSDNKTRFSTFGSWVDIAAPGIDIYSSVGSKSYTTYKGTSMSSPQVAGTAALIKFAFPTYSNQQIIQRLCETADKTGAEGKHWKCGRVNAYKAVQGGGGTVPTSPPDPTNPPGPTPTVPPISSQNYQVKINFQGINTKSANQTVSYNLYSGTSSVASGSTVASSNSTGIYTIQIPKSEVSKGSYTLLIKGESHLQKKYNSVSFTQTEINLSGKEEFVPKAGEVTGDNMININDVSKVSRYYTDFSVPVNYSSIQMASSDINKDGAITIQDLALLGINWSELEVAGDNI